MKKTKHGGGRPQKFPWTEDMLSYLREHYYSECASDIADVIGCSSTTVINKARELGLEKDPGFRKINFAYRYARKPGVNEEGVKEKEG